MNTFHYNIPQTIYFEENAVNRLPEILKKINAGKVLVISDNGLKAVGLVEKVCDIIEGAGIETETFTDVVANPTVEVVEAAFAVYQNANVDAVIGLGGGSPMDVSKAVSVLAKYGGKITDYDGTDMVPGPIGTLIAIATTAGTGSESTPSSVITDTARHHKFSVFSHMIIPQYAILDPTLITSIPPHVAASCGVDALIHAMESYISVKANPFTEAMALKAMSMIGANIKRYVANRNDLEAAGNMLVGSNLAGIAFSWSRLGNVHAMSHPVSAFFGVAHGVANAVLLPTILDYNKLADNGKYREMYNAIFGKNLSPEEFEPEDLVKEITYLNETLGIPSCLADVGVTEDKIENMALDAITSGNIAANPRSTTVKDIIGLYHKALY